MDKVAMSRPHVATNALALRVVVSVGVGMFLIASSGCHKQDAFSDTPKTALAPPAQSPAAMARAEGMEAQQREIQQQFFATNRPSPNGAPMGTAAPSAKPKN